MVSRPLRTFSGAPRVTGVTFHRSQTTAFKRVVSQRRLCTRLRTIPFDVSIRCPSVLLSRPSQTPWSSADSNLLTSGRLLATVCPTSKIGFRYGMCRICSYAVVVETCRLWNRVCCHAACRGNHVSKGLSKLIVLPAVRPDLDLVGCGLTTYDFCHPFCSSVPLVDVSL